jgi:hypothetical protein
MTAAKDPKEDADGNGEALARWFHSTYERLAPSFGYETRTDTKAFDPDTPNGRLMIAVCAELVALNRPVKESALVKPPREYEVSGDAGIPAVEVSALAGRLLGRVRRHTFYAKDERRDSLAREFAAVIAETFAYTPKARPTASDGEATKALVVAVEDFIDQPPHSYGPEPMEVRDYRHALHRVWSPLRDAILAALPTTDGAGELKAIVWKRTSVTPPEWVLEIKGTIGNTFGSWRHTEPLSTPIDDVPGLPSLYSTTDGAEPDRAERPAIEQNAAMREELAHVGNLVSDLARAMRVDQANADGSWPDLAGRLKLLIDRATPPTTDASERVREAIPESVYWNAESGNFYDMVSRRGQGQAFFTRWFPRRDEFPPRPADAVALPSSETDQ